MSITYHEILVTVWTCFYNRSYQIFSLLQMASIFRRIDRFKKRVETEHKSRDQKEDIKNSKGSLNYHTQGNVHRWALRKIKVTINTYKTLNVNGSKNKENAQLKILPDLILEYSPKSFAAPTARILASPFILFIWSSFPNPPRVDTTAVAPISTSSHIR